MGNVRKENIKLAEMEFINGLWQEEYPPMTCDHCGAVFEDDTNEFGLCPICGDLFNQLGNDVIFYQWLARGRLKNLKDRKEN